MTIIKTIKFLQFCYKLGAAKNYKFKTMYDTLKDIWGEEILKGVRDKKIDLVKLQEQYLKLTPNEFEYIKKCGKAFIDKLRKNESKRKFNTKVNIKEVQK